MNRRASLMTLALASLSAVAAPRAQPAPGADELSQTVFSRMRVAEERAALARSQHMLAASSSEHAAEHA
ncbi:MAG: hypothetical protein AAGI01_18140, partial [Myxococcota bacterium]